MQSSWLFTHNIIHMFHLACILHGPNVFIFFRVGIQNCDTNLLSYEIFIFSSDLNGFIPSLKYTRFRRMYALAIVYLISKSWKCFEILECVFHCFKVHSHMFGVGNRFFPSFSIGNVYVKHMLAYQFNGIAFLSFVYVITQWKFCGL